MAMTDKAYIVANKEQELEVLNEFKENKFVWIGVELPTEWVTSEEGLFVSFPYMLIGRGDGKISWAAMDQLEDETVVYDGRKEEKKYKVTEEFMNELIDWRNYENIDTTSGRNYAYLCEDNLEEMPRVVDAWWLEDNNPIERNKRLISIIQWLNGEDVFEVEAPHKFVVRSDKKDHDGYYAYVAVENDMTTAAYTFVNATKFDTLEEAQEWANSHQVVVEIDEEGNEAG